MVSDSSIYMTKAVGISVLLHLFVLLMMNFFLYELPVAEVFPVIRVQLAPLQAAGSVVEAAAAEAEAPRPVAKPVIRETAQPEGPEAAQISEPVVVREPAAKIPREIPIQSDASSLDSTVPAEEIPAPVAETITDTVSETPVEDTAFESDMSIDAAETAALSETAPLEALSGAVTAENGEESAEAAAVAPEGEMPDLMWNGGAAFVRSIPEPDFHIPYGTNPPDEISVSFLVKPDGTVGSVRILTYTGYPALDSEIRRYVALFLFESFDSVEQEKSGVLTLNLKAGGGSPW